MIEGGMAMFLPKKFFSPTWKRVVHLPLGVGWRRGAPATPSFGPATRAAAASTPAASKVGAYAPSAAVPKPIHVRSVSLLTMNSSLPEKSVRAGGGGGAGAAGGASAPA